MDAHWVDLQVNGYAGVDFNAPGLTPEAVRAVTERLAADGTAAFLPTLVTGDPEMLLGTIRAVVAARKRYPACEKAIRGFFLEGPFISSEPGAVGTHPVEWVRPPDLALFGRFQDAAEGLVRIVNVAAEEAVLDEKGKVRMVATLFSGSADSESALDAARELIEAASS